MSTPGAHVDQQAQFNVLMQRLQVHPEFYEPLERYQPGDGYLKVARGFVPVTCQVHQQSFWTHIRPIGSRSLMQGWKIHVSATPLNAAQVLTLAGQVCVAAGVPFKFASDARILDMLLSKGCARGSSGKFMTIYPNSVQECQQLLDALYMQLEGQEGPYVLSDRRYRDSKVIYYRYGGILPVTRQDVAGEKTSYLLSPELEEVADQRLPYMHLPEWVTDPFQAPEPDEDLVLCQGRFEVTEVLAHSNTGGVYLAQDRHTERQVIIKEARPHINLSAEGDDAVEKLRKEDRLLRRLSGSGIAPEPICFFMEWEHAFLVQEYLRGKTLHGYAARRSKVIRTDVTRRELSIWRREVLRLAAGVIRLVARLHAQQIVFGDLSANNVMILRGPGHTFELKLIDFEGACELGVDRPVNLFTPGYAPPSRMNRSSVRLEDDHFALGALLMALIHPINVLNGLNPEVYQVFGSALQQDFAFPPAYLAAIDTLTRTGGAANLDTLAADIERRSRQRLMPQILTAPSLIAPGRLEQAAQRTLDYVLSVADGQRADRLFPVGPHLSNPLSVDHGALGVALAFQQITGAVPPEVRAWITQHPAVGRLGPGYFAGLGGVISALLRLGEVETARLWFRRFGESSALFEQVTLGHGACGYGLAALHLHHVTGDLTALQEALRIGEVLHATVELTGDQARWPRFGPPRVGLAQGGSGVALFLLYLARVTGETRHLRLGRQALAADLACGRRVGGTAAMGFPQAPEGGILYPYLLTGSAGVSSVLLRYHQFDPQPGDADVLAGVRAATQQKYTLFPGLNAGLSGLGMYLLDLHQFQADDQALLAAHRAAEGVLLFALERPAGLAFPGDYLHRISADLGTGGAGVALFLHRLACGGNHPYFPDELLGLPRGLNA